MSLFAKHNQLPTSLSGHFSIINLNSNINIKNSTIEELTPSFVINNGQTLIFDTNVNNALEKNVILDSSKNYIDDLQYNKFKYSYIEKSIYPYNLLNFIPDIDPLLDNTSETKLLIIPSTITSKDGKQDYVEKNDRLNLGDGNEFYSTHFLTNTIYGYWGNKYGGLWIKDYSNSLSSLQEFKTFITTSPRNLNGHILDITYIGNDLNELNIKNFYNGILNVTISGSVEGNTKFNILNNNLQLNIKFPTSSSFNTFNLYDNKDINIIFEKNTKRNYFLGDNNYVSLVFKKDVAMLFDLFKDKSWGNKVSVSAVNMVNLSSYFIDRLDNNNTNCGNYITVLNLPQKIDKFINDTSETFTANNNFMNFIIDEVHVKKNRDVTDIGSIIGWPANLSVPRGYYKCDGSLVKVDLNNPQDEYYNGQLAYYLNGNLTTPTIKLPNIPSAIPSCMITDPNYYPLHPNFQVNGHDGLIYIIKYNNNFENKKGN